MSEYNNVLEHFGTTTLRFLDLLHTALMWGGLWTILIGYFGQALRIDILPGYVRLYAIRAGDPTKNAVAVPYL